MFVIICIDSFIIFRVAACCFRPASNSSFSNVIMVKSVPDVMTLHSSRISLDRSLDSPSASELKSAGVTALTADPLSEDALDAMDLLFDLVDLEDLLDLLDLAEDTERELLLLLVVLLRFGNSWNDSGSNDSSTIFRVCRLLLLDFAMLRSRDRLGFCCRQIKWIPMR